MTTARNASHEVDFVDCISLIVLTAKKYVDFKKHMQNILIDFERQWHECNDVHIHTTIITVPPLTIMYVDVATHCIHSTMDA